MNRKTVSADVINRFSSNVLMIFRICREEGISAEEFGKIFGTLPEQNIKIGIELPPRRY